MIFFGQRTGVLEHTDIANTCRHCGHANVLRMTLYYHYAHVYWIPFFPMGVSAATECAFCKRILLDEQFPKDLRAVYQELDSKRRIIPVWTYTGIIVVVAVLLYGIIGAMRSEPRYIQVPTQIPQMIAAPQKGDLYEMKMDSQKFVLYRVIGTKDDSIVLFEPSKAIANQAKDLVDMKSKGDDAFGKKTLGMLKKDLRKMYDEGKVLNVQRQETK